MIDPKTLRLGNLIQTLEGKFLRVVMISENNVDTVPIGGGEKELFRFEQVKPIELTKVWLTFFGFEFFGKSHWMKASKKGYLHLLMYDGAMVVDSTQNAIWCNLGIKNVNHLQNVFFDTQEEELLVETINDDKEAEMYKMIFGI